MQSDPMYALRTLQNRWYFTYDLLLTSFGGFLVPISMLLYVRSAGLANDFWVIKFRIMMTTFYLNPVYFIIS